MATQYLPFGSILEHKKHNIKISEEYDKYIDKSIVGQSFEFNRELSSIINHVIEMRIKGITEKDIETNSQIQSLLNKLNKENFDSIVSKIMEIKYTKLNHFTSLSTMIIDKALMEHQFIESYAHLCESLSQFYITININTSNEEHEEKVYFKRQLLDTCQKMFNHYITGKTFDKDDSIARIKAIGFFKFVSTLYLMSIVSRNVITTIIVKLGEASGKLMVNATESLCELLNIIIPRIDTEDKQMYINIKGLLEKLNGLTTMKMREKCFIESSLEVVDKYSKSMK